MQRVISWLMAILCLSSMAMPACAANAAEEKEPIKIELPEPFFGGTPFDGGWTNLEPEDFKPRQPFMAPQGTKILSRGKPVTSSVKAPLHGDLRMVVDGDKNYNESSVVELEAGLQWIQIDLEAEHGVYAVLLWHFHKGKRVYFDVIVQLSDDPEFKTGVTTIYNNDVSNSARLGIGRDKDYFENNKGRLIDAKGTKAHYVRCYSNGNCWDDKNHYVEIEVFGRPMK